MNKYFTATLIIQTCCLISLVIFVYLEKRYVKSKQFPLLIMVVGLVAILCGIASGVNSIRESEAKKAKILEVVAPKVNSIIGCFQGQYSSMAIAAKKMGLDHANPSEEQIKEVLSQLKPRANSMMAVVQEKRMLNWLEFMNQYNQQTIMLIDEIYKFMPFLDPELINLLGELRNCYHFKHIQLVAHADFAKLKDLSSTPFIAYYKKIEPINDYYNKYLKGIGVNTPAMAIIPMVPESYQKAEEN